jgi:5-methylcytosine-specific restriction endonuclease McrA
MRTRIRDGVVVLNASFEPLGIVPVARAMVFLIRERAVLVDAVPGRTVRSAEAEFPMPRVVQFREMVRVPYRYGTVPFTRKGMLERDNYECAYCGKRASTVDHILPRSRRGLDTWMNCISACTRCNGVKADRTPEEAGMPLRFQPRIVTSRETLVLAIAATGADVEALGLTPARVTV